jgi:tRNA G18 (ribose-2'-O)-methylase SpoU
MPSGATGVLILDGTADPRAWKTLRGSMGSVFHPAGRTGQTAEALADAKHAGLAVIAAVAQNGTPLTEVDSAQTCADPGGERRRRPPAAIVDRADGA